MRRAGVNLFGRMMESRRTRSIQRNPVASVFLSGHPSTGITERLRVILIFQLVILLGILVGDLVGILVGHRLFFIIFQ